MRAFVAFAAIGLIASPAFAADGEFAIPPQLTDPAMGQQLGKMMGVLTKAVMDMPIGEVQAAVEGREPTPADRNRKVRDLTGGDPNFDQKIENQVAQAMPRMQAGMEAMAASLPAMMKALEQAAEQMEGSLDRATANLPQPGYPKQ